MAEVKASDYADYSDEELDRIINGGASMPQAQEQLSKQSPYSDYSDYSDEELDRIIAQPSESERQSARYRQEIQNTIVPSTSSMIEDAVLEGAKGAGRAVKAIGGAFVGLGSGAVRLVGTPVRALTGWDGLHRVADSIDSGYEDWGSEALASELPDDDWGRVIGGFGEKMAGTAGSLGAMAAGGGLAKLGAAGKFGAASKAVGTAGAALQKSLPFMFGNDAAVRTYDTAKENGSGTLRALGLASVNGAIHYFGFKAFENQSLNKMLGMPQEMGAMMPAWANAARDGGAKTFTELASGVRNGMYKYILAERAKGALKAGGIMGLQNFLSSVPTQMAEGVGVGDVDWGRAVSEGVGGVEEGALMEGLMGGAAALKTPKAARKFIADTYFRNGYKLPNGQHVPGLLHSEEGRSFVMKQNPDMQARILDIVEHGGKVTKGELNAACLPPDMTEAELREFAKDWRKDLASEWDRAKVNEMRDHEQRVAEAEEEAEEAERAQAEEQAADDAAVAAEEARWAGANAKADAERAEEAAGAEQLAREEAYPRPVAEKPAAPEQAPAQEPTEPPVAERSNRLRRNLKPNFRHQGENQQQPAKEIPNETGNVPVEAQPEPPAKDAGRNGQQPSPQAAEGLVEGEAPRGKVPAAGEVEISGKSASNADSTAGKEPQTEDINRNSAQTQVPVSKSDSGGQKLTGGAKEEAKPTQGNKLRRGKKGKKLEAQELKADAAPKADATPAAPATQEATPERESVFENEQLEKAYRMIQSGAEKDVRAGEDLAFETISKMRGRELQKLYTMTPTDDAFKKIIDIATGEVNDRMISDEPIPEGTIPDRKDTTPATPETPAVKDNKLKPATGAKRGRKDKANAEPEAAPATSTDEQTQPASRFRDKNGGMKKTLRGAVERIASAIGNRTGKGAITPEEADAIVNGIAESSEVKHNRSARFFTPLVTDAEWQNSLGVDAESAKNLRDAVARAKTDSEMAHFFVQVDNAVKKAEAGKLSPKDAVPLYGKISEGLEKAEREGRDAAAQRLREAVEVIKPIADAVTQEDVNNFNRSTKGRKLNRQLDGSDRRGRKTISLDTKEGTVDVGTDGRTLEDVADEISGSSRDKRSLKPGEAYGKGFTAESDSDTTGTEGTRQGSTGKGGSRGGNRVLRIDEIDGDDVTVSLLDSTGRDRGVQQKMNREQWKALATAGKKLNNADPSSPQVGDNIMMSRGNAESPADRDAKFAADADYQRWLKSRKANDAEPLRQRYEMEQAKALGDSVKNAVGGVDVEYVGDRDYDPAKDNPNGGKELTERGTGRVLGIFDRDTGKLKLFRGASWKTLNHELGGHATMRFAEQEAERGNRALLDKINEAIDGAMDTPLADEVRSRYPDADEATLRDEIWAALRERPSEAMQKYVKTLQGRKWYNRAWDAIKTAWRGILSRMGFNRADLSGIDKMTPDEFNEFLDKAMIGGKTLGRLETQGGESSVRMARGPAAPSNKDVQLYLDDKEGFWKKMRRMFQDKNIILRDVEERLGITKKEESAYYAKDAAYGKNEHELTYLQKQEVEPIVAKIEKSGGSLGLFSAYLYARHSGERNAVMKAEKGIDDGSGMNKAQADAIFSAVDRLGLRAAFEDAARDVWAMNRKYLQRRADSGRMTQAEVKFLLDRYKHYVPLRNDLSNEELEMFNSSTGGWKRNELRTAKGRREAADDPFAFSIVQSEEAIRASNANEARRKFAGVVRRAAAQGAPIGEVVDGENKGGATWSFVFKDGERIDTGSPMRLASERDDIVLFKENGKLKAIKIDPGKNGRGLDLARAVTDKDVVRFNRHLEWIPRATRWMSAMRTQYVPTFIIRNMKADNLEVLLNALSERGVKGFKFFGKFVANEVSVAKGVKEYFKTGKSSDKYVQEAVENGLLTGGGMAAEGFSETTRRLSDTLAALRGGKKGAVGRAFGAVKDLISLLNSCAEYNTRMGVYKTLREEGMSVADAVSYARDVTVNFNRKGYLTPYTNAAFMFSNASIQGMGRAFKSIKSEHGKEVIAGLFLVGAAQAMLDDWLGHDDNDKSGGADSRNLTEFDKSHSLGVALPSGHRVKTGIRNPWALPVYMGRKTVELVKGLTSGEDAMKDIVNEVGQFATEPVGGNGFGSVSEFLQTLAPTIIDPFVQWGTGKDYRGHDRVKKSFDKYAPESWNGRDSTPAAYKAIAKALNFVSGGGEHRKGAFDTSPENWKLLTETVFGGVLTDVNNVISAGEHAVKAARGQPASQIVRDVPFVRDTFTNMPDSTTRYYEAVDSYNADKNEFKKTTELGRRAEMKKAHPYLTAQKGRVDALIEQVQELTHRERGEVKVGQKWVPMKTELPEARKEAFRKRRLRLQAEVLRILGK